MDATVRAGLFVLALAWVLAWSAAAFVAYAMDKRAATTGRWRTRERTLRRLEWLGGAPGALLAQGLLRHKTSKPGFRSRTRLVAALHAAALCALGWWAFAG